MSLRPSLANSKFEKITADFTNAYSTGGYPVHVDRVRVAGDLYDLDFGASDLRIFGLDDLKVDYFKIVRRKNLMDIEVVTM